MSDARYARWSKDPKSNFAKELKPLRTRASKVDDQTSFEKLDRALDKLYDYCRVFANYLGAPLTMADLDDMHAQTVEVRRVARVARERVAEERRDARHKEVVRLDVEARAESRRESGFSKELKIMRIGSRVFKL